MYHPFLRWSPWYAKSKVSSYAAADYPLQYFCFPNEQFLPCLESDFKSSILQSTDTIGEEMSHRNWNFKMGQKNRNSKLPHSCTSIVIYIRRKLLSRQASTLFPYWLLSRDGVWCWTRFSRTLWATPCFCAINEKSKPTR